MKNLKLSPAQQRVMLWLSQGWSARISHGSVVEINGKRICNVDTMKTLVRLGLVERQTNAPYWMATADGRKLSQNCSSNDEEGKIMQDQMKTEQERLKHNRAYFEDGCACIHRTMTIQLCPAHVEDREAVDFYEKNCKCSRNYVPELGG
jgi:hypothetical protein